MSATNDPHTAGPRVLPVASAKRRRWPLVLSLVTVFVAGLAIGVGATLMVIRDRAWLRLNAVEAARLDSARLRDSLRLDDRQTQQIEEILARRYSTVLDGVRSQFELADQEVAQVLDGPQREQWHAKTDWLRRRWLEKIETRASSKP